MDETNSPTPTQKPTWRERLGAMWERTRQKVLLWKISGDRSAVIAVVLPVLLIAGAIAIFVALWPQPVAEAPKAVIDVELLRADVDNLQLQVDRLTPAESPAPDPVPARPGAPRAALRPAQPPAPAVAPTAWGTTDLDRAIAAYPSTTHLEQAK